MNLNRGEDQVTEEARVREFILILFCIGLLSVAGCAGKGEVITLELQAVKPSPTMEEGKMEGTVPGQAAGLSIAVGGFEDARAEAKRLGIRQHLWGGESYFDVPESRPGPVLAQVVADYLTHKGWKAWVARGDGGGADVILSGKLLDFSANAESKVFRTDITVKTRMTVEAKNVKDGSTVRMTLTGDGTESVFWFGPEDVQGLLNEILAQNFEKLLANTKVENGLLRLK